MEDHLLVFISSPIVELINERRAVKESIDAIPLTRPWVFESTPASGDPLEESYLSKVQACDLFILILSQNLTAPVRKEWQTAASADKPCLVFLKKGWRSSKVQVFVNALRVKWAEFTDVDDLKQQAQQAVIDELIKGYRRYHLGQSDMNKLKKDNHGGGVYFKGKGPVYIQGDVIGCDQTKIIDC
jgi:hypothetical protein